MTVKYAGLENNFVWFFGVVEDRMDPLQLGRVRVRCYNLHTDDKSKLPKDMLPWMTPLQSITSAATVEIGQSPTGLIEGSVVWGFFADGKEAQVGLVVGVLAGKPTIEGEETHDVAQRARGTDNLKNEYIPNVEPKMAYGGKYPYVKTYTSEAKEGKGHTIEIDDTPGAERLLAWHLAGSYGEINKDGRLVIKSVDNSYYLTVKDGVVYTGGNLTILVEGSKGIAVQGNVNIEVVGSMFANVGGELYANVAQNVTINAHSDVIIEVEGNTSINTVGSTTIHSDGNIEMSSDSDIIIDAGGEVTVTASKINLN